MNRKKTEDFLKMVCMAEEVNEMDDGLQTLVGNGGVRLSGRTGKTSGSCKNSLPQKASSGSG